MYEDRGKIVILGEYSTKNYKRKISVLKYLQFIGLFYFSFWFGSQVRKTETRRKRKTIRKDDRSW